MGAKPKDCKQKTEKKGFITCKVGENTGGSFPKQNILDIVQLGKYKLKELQQIYLKS